MGENPRLGAGYRLRHGGVRDVITLSMETEGLAVCEALKFDTAPQTTSGYQIHRPGRACGVR